jgi:hypothetical protein
MMHFAFLASDPFKNEESISEMGAPVKKIPLSQMMIMTNREDLCLALYQTHGGRLMFLAFALVRDERRHMEISALDLDGLKPETQETEFPTPIPQGMAHEFHLNKCGYRLFFGLYWQCFNTIEEFWESLLVMDWCYCIFKSILIWPVDFRFFLYLYVFHADHSGHTV